MFQDSFPPRSSPHSTTAVHVLSMCLVHQLNWRSVVGMFQRCHQIEQHHQDLSTGRTGPSSSDNFLHSYGIDDPLSSIIDFSDEIPYHAKVREGK